MFKDEAKGNLKSGKDFGDYNANESNKEDNILANTPVKVLTATSIIGDKVENFKGEQLGVIKNIMLNIQTGCIDYMVLEFGAFLGLGGKLFAIPHKAFTLDAARQKFLLDRDKDSFRQMPGFDKNHWPETNSRHFTDVNNFWGYGYTVPKDNADSGYST